MRKFVVIWLGETVSVFASGLTSFVLGVWIYETTDSVSLLALNILALALPYLLLSPLGGVLADRWDRKALMILGDTGAGISAVIIMVLVLSGDLQVWHVIATSAMRGASTAFQWPAYSASIALLVPKDQLGRAGGMSQAGEALSYLAAPVLAGSLYVLPGVGITGVVLIDFVTYFIAVGTLLVVRIPNPEREDAADEKNNAFQDFVAGLRYIVERRSLVYILGYFALMYFLAEFTNPLVQPLLLELTTPEVMGRSLSIMAAGMVVGIVVVSVWGGPKRRMHAILLPGIVSGVAFAFAGLRPSLVLITVAGFWYFAMWPIIEAMNQALWQVKVRPDYQGRVFSTREVVVAGIRPLALVLAGPLADRVFEPQMAEGGALARILGPVIGTGPGRGVAVMIVIVGILTVFLSAGAYLLADLRLLEDRVPDALP